MALEVMKRIMEAEQKADALKAQAIERADAIRAEARARSDELLSGVKRNAKAQEEQKIAAAVTGSQKEVDAILAQADETCKQIRQAAAQKKDEAVTAIIGKVVGNYGNR